MMIEVMNFLKLNFILRKIEDVLCLVKIFIKMGNDIVLLWKFELKMSVVVKCIFNFRFWSMIYYKL